MGGAQVYLHRLVKDFPPPYQHSIICLFGEGLFAQRFRELGVEVQCLHLEEQVRKRSYLSALRQVLKALRSQSPDGIICHLTWSRLLALPAAFFAGIQRRYAVEHGDIYFTSWKWKSTNFILQFFAHKIICVSQAMADWLASHYKIQSHRLYIIPNSLDTEGFKAQRELSKSELVSHKDSFVFCTIGMMGSGVDKAIHIIVEAMSLLETSSIELVVCGSGPKLESLKALAEDKGVSASVHFLGRREDIPDILATSDAYVHAAPFEPFGLVCLEAMWMGAPPLVPNTGGIAEIVSDGKDGVVYQSLDATDLAKKMDWMANNADLKRLAKNARSTVEQRYTMNKYYQKLLEVLV